MYKILLRFKRFIKRALKVKAETRQDVSTRASSKIYKYLMLVVSAVLVSFLYPAENLFRPLDFPQKGEVARKDIIAPFRIVVSKSEQELREDKRDATEAIPTIIDYDSDLVDSMLSKFDRFVLDVDNSINQLQIRQKQNIDIVGLANFRDSLTNQIAEKYPFLSESIYNRLFEIQNIKHSEEIVRDILTNEIYFSGVLSNLNTLPAMPTQSVIMRIGKREVFFIKSKLVDLSKAYANFWSALNYRAEKDSINIDDCYELGRHFIIPNLKVNAEEIAARRIAAEEEIQLIKEIVDVGDVIARSGDEISERQEGILSELYRQKQSELVKDANAWLFFPVLARFALILAAFLILYLYLYYFHHHIYVSNPKLLALFFIYAIELVFVYFIGIKLGSSVYLYPIAIFSILVTVLFDSEIGTVNVFVFALILGVLHRFNFPLVLIATIVGITASYSIQHVKQRSEFFRPIIYLSLVYIILVAILESFQLTPSENLVNLIGYGVANAVLSPLLAMGILPIFESLFGFTTNITLLELSDLNRPLLKRLSLEAPGTYHHSILVGNLAEAAAKAINGNPLLARVGAYYHDIGKMEIPEYFVENQLGIKSKHESLTPTMSSIILSSHIKKGRAIGEDADLPDEVLNFIEEHHGTMVMKYFYNKAKELGEAKPVIDEFKYPGPKPQIRETGIVMLADSVEAASRTLTEPKPSRLKNLVQGIINDRFESGELEDCPLTLKDLALIRESFSQILIGVFHHRIEYPDKEEEK